MKNQESTLKQNPWFLDLIKSLLPLEQDMYERASSFNNLPDFKLLINQQRLLVGKVNSFNNLAGFNLTNRDFCILVMACNGSIEG